VSGRNCSKHTGEKTCSFIARWMMGDRMQDDEKLRVIASELAALKAVLLEQLITVAAAPDAPHSSLWLSSDDAEAVATALSPKMQRSASDLQATMFELVTLELAVDRRVDAVVLANLMPRYWAQFIRSSSEEEARSMGTRPRV
jgi:MoxR-like ATPase